MINCAQVSLAAKTPTQLRLFAVVTTGPQSALVSALSGKVMCTPQPADPLGKAEPSVKRDWVFEGGIAINRYNCHVVLSFLMRGETLEIRVRADSLGLCPLPGRPDPRKMTEPDAIDQWG